MRVDLRVKHDVETRRHVAELFDSGEGLRAILLTVHESILSSRRAKENARTVTDTGIVRVRHNVAHDVVSAC